MPACKKGATSTRRTRYRSPAQNAVGRRVAAEQRASQLSTAASMTPKRCGREGLIMRTVHTEGEKGQRFLGGQKKITGRTRKKGAVLKELF